MPPYSIPSSPWSNLIAPPSITTSDAVALFTVFRCMALSCPLMLGRHRPRLICSGATARQARLVVDDIFMWAVLIGNYELAETLWLTPASSNSLRCNASVVLDLEGETVG